MGSHETNGQPQGVVQDDLVMPLIDFSAFQHGTPSERHATAQQISHAFQTSGFLYLHNHGIPPATVAAAFAHSAAFFARPQHEKDALAWTTPDANRGYVPPGREKVTQSADPAEIARLRATNPDLKESMEIGREGVPGLPNRWPDRFGDDDDAGAAAFTRFMKDFFTTCKSLHVELMRAIGMGMGLTPDFFDPYTDGGDNNLRLLHYPAVPAALFTSDASRVRAGAHSDYGSVTLLFQDRVGGLEVQSPRGTWVRATPIPGAIVVNAGDLLSRWSNGRVRSTRHRVVQPPPGETGVVTGEDGEVMVRQRYSIAYFCNPNFDAWIEALPGTFEEGGKKFAGINSGDYLVQRLAATY